MTSNSEKRREEHQREKRRCTKYPEGKEAGKKKGFPVEGKKEGSSDKNREQVVSKEVVRRHTQAVKAKKYAFARIPKRYTFESKGGRHVSMENTDLSESRFAVRSQHTSAHRGQGVTKRKVGELRGKKIDANSTAWYVAHWEEGNTDDDTWEQAAGLGSDEWLVSEWEAEQTALRTPAISVRK